MPKGHVKVEMFDVDTGKKVYERRKGNFISRFVLDHYLRYQMMNTLVDGRYTSAEYPGNKATAHFNDPFYEIRLTTATHSEQPMEEWLPRGREIGFATTTGSYSGSDEFRGTINRDESFSRIGHLRMVFDWPTNAANGTFNSVYFKPDASYRLDNGVYFEVMDDPYSTFRSIEKYDDKYYILGRRDDGGLKTFIDRYDSNFNLEQSYDLGNNYRDFTIRDNEFLLSGYGFGAGESVSACPISQPDDVSVLFETDDFLAYGISYDEDEREIHLLDYDAVAIFDSSYNLKERRILEGGSRDSNMYFLGYGWLIHRDVWSLDGEIRHDMGIQAGGLTDDHFYYSHNGAIKRLPKYGIGSRALLDDPVTKTSNVTMKITYDFMYS